MKGTYCDNCLCEVHNTKGLAPSNPHFRKKIQHTSHLISMLMIPREFVEKYGTNLSSPAVFMLPNGSKFEIELLRNDDGVWLEKGWPEFAEKNSVEIKQTLFFGLERKSEFHVVILDKNGVEVDYAFVSSNTQSPKKESETLYHRNPKREFVIEILDDSPPTRFSSPQKKMKREFEEGTFRRSSSTPNQKTQALFRTRGFTSRHPNFIVVMQKSHLNPRYDMAVRQDFWRDHLIGKSGEDVTLYVSQGRTWLVKPNPRIPHLFLCSSWKEFVNGNNLKIGDVCIFELLMNNDEIMFKVTIDRSEGDQESQDQVKGKTAEMKTEEFESRDRQETRKVEPPGKKFGTSNCTDSPSSARKHFFKVELKESCRERLIVPQDFARDHFEQKPQDLILQVGTETWPVKLVVTSKHMHIFSAGWRAFVKDNNLRPGDSCGFELDSGGKDDHIVLNFFRYGNRHKCS